MENQLTPCATCSLFTGVRTSPGAIRSLRAQRSTPRTQRLTLWIAGYVPSDSASSCCASGVLVLVLTPTQPTKRDPPRCATMGLVCALLEPPPAHNTRAAPTCSRSAPDDRHVATIRRHGWAMHPSDAAGQQPPTSGQPSAQVKSSQVQVKSSHVTSRHVTSRQVTSRQRPSRISPLTAHPCATSNSHALSTPRLSVSVPHEEAHERHASAEDGTSTRHAPATLCPKPILTMTRLHPHDDETHPHEDETPSSRGRNPILAMRPRDSLSLLTRLIGACSPLQAQRQVQSSPVQSSPVQSSPDQSSQDRLGLSASWAHAHMERSVSAWWSM